MKSLLRSDTHVALFSVNITKSTYDELLFYYILETQIFKFNVNVGQVAFNFRTEVSIQWKSQSMQSYVLFYILGHRSLASLFE